MRLTTEAFASAKEFMQSAARPLERALFLHEFDDAPAAGALAALATFKNEDGGFGRGLEPDLWLPASSVLCTIEALHVLRELGLPLNHELVTGAVDWLVEAFDPKLSAWRQVTLEAEAHPHAAHWKWNLHADGTRWPVGVLPRAEVLSHLWRSPDRVPRELLDDQTRRLVHDFESCESLSPDSVARCEHFVKCEPAPDWARDAVARQIRKSGSAIVSRDAADWEGDSAKPLKLAPLPDCVLAEPLAAEVKHNLAWEIDHQDADGSWAPNWSWGEAFPNEWAIAETSWRGFITLHTLRSLRAYGCLSEHRE